MQSNFIEQAADLLLPHVWSVDDRKDLLSEAFLTTHSWVRYEVPLDGTARAFSVNAVNTLGEMPQGNTYLETLFVTLRRISGDADQKRIDRLLAELPSFFASRPQATVPQAPTAPTSSTGRPTLFFSYSDEDSENARRLAEALASNGHVPDLERDPERGSDAWLTATAEGLSNAYAVVLLVGDRTATDRWTRLELLAALDKRKAIVPILLPGGRLPTFLPSGMVGIEFPKNGETGLDELLQRIPAPPAQRSGESWGSRSPALLERMRELRYMDRLKLEELRHVSQYTRLSGESQLRRGRGDRLEVPAVVARQEMVHARWRRNTGEPVETRRFEDAIPELKAIGRAVLLGEPGAGKTTTLFKLAADLIDVALFDRQAPIPLLIRMGFWTDLAEPFTSFLRRSVGEMAEGLESRLAANQAALLLDGLNEIPSDQQARKYQEIDSFLGSHTSLSVVVTCRELDYPAERALALDRVTVAPLDPVRVYEFIHNYLDEASGTEKADELFWHIAGAKAWQTYRRFRDDNERYLLDPFVDFWLADDLPEGVVWGYQSYYWNKWRSKRTNPASLLLLSQNPYMLFMLIDVYRSGGHTLPANRGELLDSFVETLLLRERVLTIDPETGQVLRLPMGISFLDSLTDLAYEMQRRRAGEGNPSALTTLPLRHAARILTETQRKIAASATILVLGDDVRFAHQLLQEYFVARAMNNRIFEISTKSQPLKAESIWTPDRWWVPTNWEEATILLAGLYNENCAAIVEWVASANPEVAARCIVESGAKNISDTLLLSLGQRWLEFLTDLKKDSEVQARIAVGRALGLLTLSNGMPIDNRQGVGVLISDGLPLPDITWSATVPAGRHIVRDNFERLMVTIDTPYQLSSYPVTNSQFNCFLNAPDYTDEQWWVSTPIEGQLGGSRNYAWGGDGQTDKYTNYPRVNVNWFEALAFCRWLSNRIKDPIDLPTKYEWLVAVSYSGHRFMIWNNLTSFVRRRTTNEEGIYGVSAVGTYLHGNNSSLRLFDMGNNVREWLSHEGHQDWSPSQSSILTGMDLMRASVTFRKNELAIFKNNALGFRVIRRSSAQEVPVQKERG